MKLYTCPHKITIGDVGRIEPLLADVEFQKFDQPIGDVLHDLARAFVVQKERAITFEGAIAHLIDAGFEVEGELNVGAEEIGFDRIGDGPVLKLLQEEQARDGIQFLGGSSEGGMEVSAQLPRRHEFEEGGAKDALPAVVNLLESERGNHAFEGIKEASLLRIDGVAHNP